MINVSAKLTSKAAVEIAKTAAKVAGTGVLTNPATLTAATVLGLGYMGYKHLENKDKRKYEYAR